MKIRDAFICTGIIVLFIMLSLILQPWMGYIALTMAGVILAISVIQIVISYFERELEDKKMWEDFVTYKLKTLKTEKRLDPEHEELTRVHLDYNYANIIDQFRTRLLILSRYIYVDVLFTESRNNKFKTSTRRRKIRVLLFNGSKRYDDSFRNSPWVDAKINDSFIRISAPFEASLAWLTDKSVDNSAKATFCIEKITLVYHNQRLILPHLPGESGVNTDNTAAPS